MYTILAKADVVDFYKRHKEITISMGGNELYETCTDQRMRTHHELFSLPLPIREVVYCPYDNPNRELLFEVLEEMKEKYVKENNIIPSFLEPKEKKLCSLGHENLNRHIQNTTN